jgi:Nif-specific regulatory protein
VVVATHRNLVNDVAMGRFRRDLYYRLNVVPIRLPALRERPEDIKPLALHFLSRANQAHQRNLHFSEGAWRWLAEQAWPGNIRELGNLVERSVLLGQGPVLEALDLRRLAEQEPHGEAADAPALEPLGPSKPSAPTRASAAFPVRDYRSVNSHTGHALREALEQAGGNQSRAARALGLSPRQFAYRWRQLGLGTA